MSATLGFDHPCLACGYNLRGLAIAASCPECGVTVVDSLKRRLLRHADAQYVRRLRSGARAITIALLTPFIWTGALVILLNAPMDNLSGSEPFLFTTQLLIPLIGIGLCFFGWFRLTTPDADDAPQSAPARRRARCRTATTWLLITMILSIGVAAATEFNASALMESISVIVAITIVGLLIAQQVFGLRLIKDLALRLPSKGLATYATVVLWFLIATIALTALAIVSAWLGFRGMTTAGFGSVAMVFAAIHGIALFAAFLIGLVTFAMYIGLFSRLWFCFSKCAKVAAAMQAQTPPASPRLVGESP